MLNSIFNALTGSAGNPQINIYVETGEWQILVIGSALVVALIALPWIKRAIDR